MDATAYEDLIRLNAERFNIDRGLLSRLIQQESAFNPNAVSPKGAQGLGQVMPDTARDPGYGVTPLAAEDLMNPAENIRFSAEYLSKMLEKFEDPRLALAAYNAGPGAVMKYDGIPPFEETQNYVTTIMGGPPETSLRPKLRPDDLQTNNNSSVDGLMDSLAYLDLAGMSGGATRPADLGSRITPGSAGSGGRALKRLGIASLV